MDSDGSGGPEESVDGYPPETEGIGNVGTCETGPDKDNCAKDCGGEDECECARGGACAYPDVLGCGYVVPRT
jgi:hypothetical protein